MLTDHQICQLVTEGLALRDNIEREERRLKEIEELLKETGLKKEHEYLEDPDREGRRWLARGEDKAVPVIFTADKLVGSFKAGSAMHQTIKTVAGDEFPSFFQSKHIFENRFDDGKKFRNFAAELLGAKGPAFVTACLAREKDGIAKSDVKVLWKEPIAI